MRNRSQVRLPANRAFVVQFVGTPAATTFEGRAEHLASGQVIQFESLDHLAAFVIDVLDTTAESGGAAG